jgi:hypothetical protein
MNLHGNNGDNTSTDADGGRNVENSVESETLGGVDPRYGGGGGGSGEHGDVVDAMEGYTPLNFNMNEFVMVHDGSDDDSYDGVSLAILNEEMDGESFPSGYYHMMGAAPRRVNGVKDSFFGYAISHNNDDDDDDSSHTDTSDSGIENPEYNSDGINSMQSLEVPDDFHLLAESALRGLEIEHSSALGMSTDMDRDEKSSENFALTSPLTQSTVGFPSGHGFCDGAEIQTVDDLLSDTDTSDSPIESAIQPSTVAAISAVATAIIPTKESQSFKTKPMDISAIHKAMQSIRLKSPQLATALDAGALSSLSTTAAGVATDATLASIIDFSSRVMEESRHKQLQIHPIIPMVPLAAFRRVTPKAQAASANLTRSATLSEAVLRLWPLICFRRKNRATEIGILSQRQTTCSSKTLTIHIVGADGAECSSEALVHKSVGPFVRWLNAAIHSGILGECYRTRMTAQPQLIEIDAVLIEFSGPNLPGDMIGNVMDLLPPPSITPSSGLISAKATFHQREYHEVSSCADVSLADLAIAYNAGIWGYDSWKPTIEWMTRGINVDSPAHNKLLGNTIFVITAYTLEESEDDAAVITDLVETIALSRSQENSHAIARQLWTPEPNPFSSRLERYTASAPPGRKYFENGAWQAWLLGV